MTQADTVVLILAGGEATRFPGKLGHEIDGVPMLVRTYRNVRGRWPVALSVKEPLAPVLAAQIDAALVVDRVARRGPLAGIVRAFEVLESRRSFVVAGDAPNVTLDELDALDAAWSADVDAVLARNASDIEPLVALYDRVAMLEAGRDVLATGSGAVRDAVARLRTTTVRLSDRALVNVNTQADLP